MQRGTGSYFLYNDNGKVLMNLEEMNKYKDDLSF